ncbi:MAG: cytidine deaminase [Saccharofermentanales bacterium]
MQWDTLVQEAFTARKTAYTPYSGFAVGAALQARNGDIYRGCNIENAAFSPTNCAERTAIFKAISEGVKEFDAIAICGGYDNEPQFCFPCGVCRQVLMEFCNPETFQIIIAKSVTEYRSYLLKEILPFAFGPSNFRTGSGQ